MGDPVYFWKGVRLGDWATAESEAYGMTPGSIAAQEGSIGNEKKSLVANGANADFVHRLSFEIQQGYDVHAGESDLAVRARVQTFLEDLARWLGTAQAAQSYLGRLVMTDTEKGSSTILVFPGTSVQIDTLDPLSLAVGDRVLLQGDQGDPTERDFAEVVTVEAVNSPTQFVAEQVIFSYMMPTPVWEVDWMMEWCFPEAGSEVRMRARQNPNSWATEMTFRGADGFWQRTGL